MSDSTTQRPLPADLRLAIDTIKDYAIFLLDPDGIDLARRVMGSRHVSSP